jgi:hypothetical protein
MSDVSKLPEIRGPRSEVGAQYGTDIIKTEIQWFKPET